MSFNDNFAASLCSMWEIMKFSVKCGGYWVKNHRGEVGYIGGEVMTINCKSEELLTHWQKSLEKDYVLKLF